MAFSLENLTLGRGQFNNFSTKIGSFQHMYVSSDPLLTMLVPSYFPPYLGTSKSNNESVINQNDMLLIGSTSDNLASVYFIKSLNPITFSSSSINSFYVEYRNVSYAGPTSGTLDIAFSREGSTATFYVIKSTTLNTGSGGHYLVNISPPPICLPHPNYNLGDPQLSGSAIGICGTISGGINFFMNIVIRPNAAIQIFQMKLSDFAGGATIPLQNFSYSYLGIPLV